MEEKEIIELIGKIFLKNETFHAKAEVWENIQKRLVIRKQRIYFRHLCYWGASVAAMICLSFMVYTSGINLKSGNTPIGIQLPDGSSACLSANSSLAYNKLLWHFNRRLTLIGDATFDVVKGKRFSVETSLGCISVLGTRFFVSQQNDTLHVSCSEGVVCVETPSGKQTLHPGEQVVCNETSMFYSEMKEELPEELPEYLEYENTPLLVVARKIEEIYGLQIVTPELCEGLSFSGMVSTQSREEAVSVIFGVCNLKYTISGNELILSR